MYIYNTVVPEYLKHNNLMNHAYLVPKHLPFHLSIAFAYKLSIDNAAPRKGNGSALSYRVAVDEEVTLGYWSSYGVKFETIKFSNNDSSIVAKKRGVEGSWY